MKNKANSKKKSALPPNCIVIPKHFLDVANTDAGREVLHGAIVESERREVCVTNGRALAVLPIPGDAPVKPCYIKPEKFKAAKAMLKPSEPLLLDYVAGTLAGLDLDPPDCLGHYPNYPAVIPQDAPVYRQFIDPSLLLDVARAMGFTPGGPALEIELLKNFGGSVHEPLRLKIGDATGVLMPVSPGKDGPATGLLPAGEVERGKLPERSDDEKSAEIERLNRLLAANENSRRELDSTVNTLQIALCETRERVRQYEAHIDQLHAAGPIPTPPAREAKPDTPKEVPAASGPPTLARNEEKNGIELRFDGKPDDATRDAMKARGFRWRPRQPGQPWCVRYSEEAWVFAMALSEGRGMPVAQPGEAPAAPADEPAPPAPAPRASGHGGVHTAVIHGGESITPEDLAKRLFSGRDALLPTAAERAAAQAPPPRRILPDF